ncbi:MAG TPA: muconolactone Delta-isomerase family protein [Candidatus Elarobacter sp.]|jgi:muconolactone delta-isomerase|nr:muconolactone Delta-isomerase family protein [Candidatus Elarobacter sp.]
MAQFIACIRRNYEDFPEARFTPELLEAEAERARTLYRDGVFRQMWSRGDSPGAVVLLEAGSADEAAAVLETLPLRQIQMLLIDSVIPVMAYRGFGPRG